MPAPRALAGRHHGDLVRVAAPGQRVPLVARLAAPRTRRALPGLLGAPGTCRRPVRARRHRGVGRVHPHLPLQLLDLSQQRRDHRIPLRQGSQQIQQLRQATSRSTTAPIPASQRASDTSLLRRLETAHAENCRLSDECTQLRAEIAPLRRQIAHLLGEQRQAGAHARDPRQNLGDNTIR